MEDGLVVAIGESGKEVKRDFFRFFGMREEKGAALRGGAPQGFLDVKVVKSDEATEGEVPFGVTLLDELIVGEEAEELVVRGLDVLVEEVSVCEWGRCLVSSRCGPGG